LNRVGEATLNQYGAARRPMDSPEAAYRLWREVVAEDPCYEPEKEHLVARCEIYATQNGFSNIDYLLEQMIYPEKAFNALLIIDDLDEELESIVRSSLRFPVETLTITRFHSPAGEAIYQFEPFLYDLSTQGTTVAAESGNTPSIDPAEIDTIVVPAREDGFKEVFLGENMWRAIRIHSSMIPKIRYIAASAAGLRDHICRGSHPH
jgi:hypothetical protein